MKDIVITHTKRGDNTLIGSIQISDGFYKLEIQNRNGNVIYLNKDECVKLRKALKSDEQKENIFTKIKNNIRLLGAYGKPVFDPKYREAMSYILRLITIIENNENPNNMIDYKIAVT